MVPPLHVWDQPFVAPVVPDSAFCRCPSTDVALIKNLFAPIRLLHIFILQPLGGDFYHADDVRVENCSAVLNRSGHRRVNSAPSGTSHSDRMENGDATTAH